MPTITIPERDPLDLLYYEISMFNNLYFLMQKRPVNYTIDEQTINSNAQLESFLVHARTLIDFLELKQPSSDDLTCRDFDNADGNKMQLIEIPFSDSKTRFYINKHIQHLTKKRKDKKPTWDIYNIASSINQSLSLFFEQISPSYFPTSKNRNKEDFDNLINAVLVIPAQAGI